ncbi:MAG: ABC transporter ATP-binding protein [Candidatus Colwellbacteria bacterium]|nr:ABC transporter ATP-binding protein [Candidatus Colwellbacteria bacterium]
MPHVIIEKLTASYEGNKVLNDLDVVLESGEMAAIMGRSGSGKTTLLLCLLGFVPIDSGRIIIGNEDISGLSIRDRRLAYMPQDYGLFPHLSVGENIAFGLVVRGVNEVERAKKVDELLDSVELPREHAFRRVTEISGGERQRVALARALAVNPRLFLLDEPLSAVDMETRLKVGTELRRIIKKTGIPAIIITHDPEEARMLGDSVWGLGGGKLSRK